jgi:hypothetical protein
MFPRKAYTPQLKYSPACFEFDFIRGVELSRGMVRKDLFGIRVMTSEPGRELQLHSILHNIRPTNCGRDWQALSGTGSVRRCPDCKQFVYCADGLNEQQLLDLISANEKGKDAAKIRLYRRKDGTLMAGQGTCGSLPVDIALSSRIVWSALYVCCLGSKDPYWLSYLLSVLVSLCWMDVAPRSALKYKSGLICVCMMIPLSFAIMKFNLVPLELFKIVAAVLIAVNGYTAAVAQRRKQTQPSTDLISADKGKV